VINTAEEFCNYVIDWAFERFHGGWMKDVLESTWIRKYTEGASEYNFNIGPYLQKKECLFLFRTRVVMVKIMFKFSRHLSPILHIDVEHHEFENANNFFNHKIYDIVTFFMTPKQEEEYSEQLQHENISEDLKSERKLQLFKEQSITYKQIKWISLVQQRRVLHFMMGTHSRTGDNSLVMQIDPLLAKHITDYSKIVIDTDHLLGFLKSYYVDMNDEAFKQFQLDALIPDVCLACGRLCL
jgi:hypothetical protein